MLRFSLIPRIARSTRVVVPTTSIAAARIHSTATIFKKKKAEAYEDDAFAEDEDDLFGAPSPSNEATTPVSPSTPLPSLSPEPTSSSSQIDAARSARFAAELVDIQRYIGRKPSTGYSPRKTALLQLAILAQTKAELELVLESIVGWRAAKRTIETDTAEEILRRCVNLGHPELSLKMLAERPKYGVDLGSIKTARKIMHGLVERAQQEVAGKVAGGEEHPVVAVVDTVTGSASKDVLLFGALYPFYGLPEVIRDPVSVGMLLSVAMAKGQDKAVRKQGVSVLKHALKTTPRYDLGATADEREWASIGKKYLNVKQPQEGSTLTA